MKPYAPALWLLVQLSVLAALVDAGCAHGSALGAAGAGTGSGAVAGGSGMEIAISGMEIAVGLAFAPLLAALRRERWVRQPGVEDGDGALERVLVDAVLGSHALPAPWEWRCVERAWGRAVLASESLAALNTALFWHGGVQAALGEEKIKRLWAEQAARVERESRDDFARFVVADGMAPPFEDGAFDVVVSVESAAYMPDKT